MEVCAKSICQVALIIAGLVSLTSAEFQMIGSKKNGCLCGDLAKTYTECEFKSYPDGGIVNRTHKDNGWLTLDTNDFPSASCSATLSDKFKTGVGYLIACRLKETSDGPWVEEERFFIRTSLDNKLKLELLTEATTTSMTTNNSKIPFSVKRDDLISCSFHIPGQEKSYNGTVSSRNCSASIESDVVKEIVVARVVSGGLKAPTTSPTIGSVVGTTTASTVASPELATIHDILLRKTPLEDPNNFPPVLNVSTETRSPGDYLEASCKVRNNQVVVWTMDSENIKEETCMADMWPWSFQLTDCVATLKHKVEWKDNGRRLGCRLKTPSTSTRAILTDGASQLLDVRFAPRLASVALNWTTDGLLNVTLKVAANPEPNVSWAIGDGSSTIGNEGAPGMYHIETNLSHTTSGGLFLKVTLVNALGSTSSQILIGPESDTTWKLALTGALGGLCILLILVVLVLALMLSRRLGHKQGVSVAIRGEERGRCKAVESGIYAEVNEEVEYDDVWHPEYDDVDLPPAQQLKPL